MYEEIREEQIKEMYLSNPMQEKDYKTFREEIIERSKPEDVKRMESKKAQFELDEFFNDMRKGVKDG